MSIEASIDLAAESPPVRPPSPAGAGSGDHVSHLTRGVWLRSITGLLLIALLSSATFFILHHVLSVNQSSGTVVNVSGRQRMLSQRGAFFATRLVTASEPGARQKLREDLTQVAALMRKSHDGLTRGSVELGLPDQMSPAIKALYFEGADPLDRQVLQYLDHIRGLLDDAAQAPEASPIGLDNAHLQAITAMASGPLLKTLNAAVLQYEKEGAAETQRAILYEKIVYGITLLSLLLEAALIYRPLVNRVRSTTEKLVRQQQFSDHVVDTSQALIVGMNRNGQITLINDYAQTLTGYTEAEAKGRDFVTTFLPPAQDASDTAARSALFRDAQGQHTELPLLTRDGRTLTIEWSNALLTDPISGEPIMVLATGVDITQRKQAEQELHMALDQTAALSRRLQQEVEHAAVLQRALLPPPELDLPGLRGVARLTTSTEVGGDYYDYYQVDGHHAVFLIGDVSGHGVASGTLVSAAKMAVHQLATQGQTDPAAMLEHLNEALLTSSHDSMFMTMLCLSLDSRTGRLRVANAGHAFPYLWMAGEEGWGMIEVEGLPLGRAAQPRYQPVSFDMAPGDRLFLYTDGLIEQESPSGEQLGYERLEDLLFQIAPLSLEDGRDRLFDALSAHAQREGFGDDVTLMLVEHTERVERGGASPLRRSDQREIVQLDAATFLELPELPEHVSRQRVVVTHEAGEVGELLGPLSQAGVRRLLPSDQPFLRELGWQALMLQHNRPDGDDMAQWLPEPTLQQEWCFTHSDDKARCMAALRECLAASGRVSEAMQDVLTLMADELIENSLYGAPLDPWQHKIYRKGQLREVAAAEGIRVLLRMDRDRLGLAVIDRWGTFTPATFLQRLALNAQHSGLVAGVGGAGLYLMWRMSDYLQIRVKPQQETQITLLWSLQAEPDPERDSGFQFLFHHELGERLPDAA